MAIPFPEEVVTEGIGKTCACIFGIDFEDFEFGEGNLGGIEFPGIASLVGAVIEAFVEALLSFAEPVLMILDAKILDLLDWISNALSDPIAFLAEIIKMKIIDPIMEKLNIWLPPFSIEIPGFPAFDIPMINADLESEWNTPQWVAMVEGFISFLTGLILLPVYAIIKVFESIVNELSIPEIGQPLLEKIWDSIIPSFGFVPNTSQYDAVSTFGICFLDELSQFIPPPFPSGGGGGGSVPQSDQIIVTDLTANVIVSGGGTVFFNKAAATKQIKIRRSGAQTVEIAEIKVQAGATGQIHYTFASGAVTLNDDQPEITLPLTYDGYSPEGPETANIVITIGEGEETKVFTFQAQSFEKNTLDLLKRAIIDTANKNEDAWHPEVNIFGIRREHSAVNTFQDMLGIAIKSSNTNDWVIKAYKGTTRPGQKYRDLQAPPAKAGVENIKVGHYPNVWSVGNHTPGSTSAFWQFPAFVMKSPGTFMVFCDGKKNGKPDPKVGYKKVIDSLNGHRADNGYTGSPGEVIGGWSAGCQVWNVRTEFEEVMDLVMSSDTYTSSTPAVKWKPGNKGTTAGSYFNYTLMLKDNVEDLWNALNDQFNLY